MVMVKKGTVLAALLGVSVLTAACSGNSDSLKTEETAVVKVMYWDEQNFFQQYGNLFNTKFPNVEIQVVSQRSMYANMENESMDPDEAFNKFLEEEKPDVLMLNTDQYKKLAEKDALVDLSPMLAEKDFLGNEILPGIIDFLKEQANGQLYGLSPSFYSQGLYYNADLFAKHGIEPPKNKMSWKEIVDLAKRFPSTGSAENREYGLYMGYQGSPFDMGMTIGFSQGLVMSDPEMTKLSINTDAWKAAFQLGIDALKTAAPQNDFNGGSYEDYLGQNSFIAGKAAMTVNSTYFMDELKEATERSKKIKPFNWEIVSEPVDPNNPDYGSSMSTSEIFAISASSPNQKAAWELVKYINGDDAAKLLSRTSRGSMMARTKYIKDKDGKNMEAFYALKPRVNPSERFYGKMPQDFYQPFYTVAQEQLQQAADGKISLDEALKTIETKGQQELTNARKKEEAKKANGGAESKGEEASSGTSEQVKVSK
ncbi:ABC transporter substrate-binding protein [Paenibacillus sp. GCM10027626]|uniref:ABC transporter substrate-binding protein n=1 Tax=Paenibacillus sp. GCM10027626 TaxID=3273411 RepID=UPI0036386DAA